MTPEDLTFIRIEMRQKLAQMPDDGEATLRISKRAAQCFVDYPEQHDPDMPPPAICKALGPLVGDTILNAKLHRLDEMIDKATKIVMDLGAMNTLRMMK